MRWPDEPFWDDNAFKKRCQTAARKNRIPLSEALRQAGLHRGYLQYAPNRSSDHILKLSRALNTPFEYLAWGECWRKHHNPEPPPKPISKKAAYMRTYMRKKRAYQKLSERLMRAMEPDGTTEG